ncbi:FMN-binding glutamate synthase family protein [Candidatus Aerophobetes bacterium]|nr:FMN-binding glutamate synthase family protein [Candidatus Aerophobetes bacterium]
MSLSKPNASPATSTKNRVSPSPCSGLCVSCLDGCPGYCEVGLSALRGREVLYPQPFGRITAGSEKDYPVDFSHLNIQGTCVGAYGVEPDSDKAIFPAVEVSTKLGSKNKIGLRVPFFTGALGSTEVARIHWESMAVGAAISGTIITIGENVCAMDPESEIKNGRIIHSPEMERRVKAFKRWQDKDGEIIVQCNVEDKRLGVPEYVIEKLGVEAVEIKWGQGAKSIGGEVKLDSLQRALELKRKGYIVIPDPEDFVVKKAFQQGDFKEFERHSRLGMIEEEEFFREVERLRGLGAKYVTLKTGSYRPADLARAIRCASDVEIDILTVDGSGGGTGMSPWRMMNEWGIPTVYLECLIYNFLSQLKSKNSFIPACAIAGGICLEDQVFKAIALGAPFIKAVCLGRSSMTAAMVGNTIERAIKKGEVSQRIKKYGNTVEQIFIEAARLKEKYGKDFERIPGGAIGLYTYYERVKTGLQQLMAGARKFNLKHINRDDLFALTREAESISGIPFIMNVDKEEVQKILA